MTSARIRRHRAVAGAAGVAALAGAAAAVALAHRRWECAPDPCEGSIGRPVEGEPFKVQRPDGAVIHGVVAGGGPTVVLSHCWTGTRQVWGPVAHRLIERGRRVVLYDQRGHGQSTLGPSTPTVAMLGGDLAAVLEAVDARDAVIAGHSMGGMAVLALLTDEADVAATRVRAAAVVASGAFSIVARPLAVAGSLTLGHGGVERLLRSSAGPALMRASAGRRPTFAHLVAARDDFVATPPDVRLAFFSAIGALDLRHSLAGVTVPTTIVVGTADQLTPPRRARAVAAAIPGARLVEVPGAGHMLPYETPDLLTELMIAAGSDERTAR